MVKQCLKQEVEIFDKNDSKKIIFSKLENLTDDDFNGKNGEDYFIYNYNKNYYISKLEDCFEEDYNSLSLKDFIENVLNANYNEDDFYNKYEVNIIEKDNLIFVALSYTFDE